MRSARIWMLSMVATAVLGASPGAVAGGPAASGTGAADGDVKDYFDLDLEELLQMSVVSASGVEELLLNAPASMVVVTAQEIRDRGYTSLADVVQDLPGFDVSVANGTTYLLAYQRGYRTPWTQRTLVLVDGQTDNNLWSHQAELSRQYPLSNVERIEVLYGPTSVVYGPNAFLGVINIITRDGRGLESPGVTATATVEGGSYDTIGVDAAISGRTESDISFALSARLFRSDEPDLSDRWGFLSSDMYADKAIYGPLLDMENDGVRFGRYYDPTDDYGVIGKLGYKGLSIGYLDWLVKEGYGPYYASDRGQPNAFWNKASRHIYAEYEARPTDRITATTLMRYRWNRIYGNWAEALPDWEEGMEQYSYISYTQWNSVNDGWLIRQKVEWRLLDTLRLLLGASYERKQLTKAYDIPGYWNVYSSTVPADEPGPYGYGVGVGHSTDETYARPPSPMAEMPLDNQILTDDLGAFLLGMWDIGVFRLNAGVRYDWNSVYGHAVNPRATVISRIGEKGAVKLSYGEAFHEPAPVQLWGGWSARDANPNLEPEKVRTGELLAMYQLPYVFGSASVYYSHFDNVIMEDALNLGSRDVVGSEAIIRAEAPNPIPQSRNVSAWADYTFTWSRSEMSYDFDESEWVEGATELGDIAPHKGNVGLNWPLWRYFNVNVRLNWVGPRKLYAANPLRAQGEELDAYARVNLALAAEYGAVRLTFSVINLLDAQYFHPGPERANAGNDFDHRSLGFMNSVIPQPGRTFLVRVTGTL